MPLLTGIDVVGKVAAAPPRRPLSKAVARLRDEALAMVRAEQLVATAACYRFVALERECEGTLHLDGEQLHAPWLLPASGELTAVACAACTLGERLEQRVSALFAERRASLAVALDGVGNELLFALSRTLQDRMLGQARKQGLCMAGELRSGDPGLALETQSVVLRLAGAGELGVRVTATGMMHPIKTASMILGVGHALPVADWSRCDHCPHRERCAVIPRAAA